MQLATEGRNKLMHNTLCNEFLSYCVQVMIYNVFADIHPKTFENRISRSKGELQDSRCILSSAVHRGLVDHVRTRL